MSIKEHEIKYASFDDGESIRNFLSENWRKDLIYVKDPSFFDYEFKSELGYNFVLAVKDQEIEGVLGFIQYQEERANSHIQTVLWKVLPDSDNPFLGIQLLELLLNDEFKSISSVGIGKHTEKIYKYLKLQVGSLNHFYMLNPKVSSFQIARIDKQIRIQKKPVNKLTKKLIRVENFEEIELSTADKGLWYLNKRYCLHPYFKYDLQKIEGTNTVLVLRIQNYQGIQILRLIDCIGDPNEIRYVGDSLEKILIEHNYEYLDLYCSGTSIETFFQAGFSLKDPEGNIVIPDYFSPFEQSNVEIRYFTNQDKEPLFYKGDGDQDRPN